MAKYSYRAVALMSMVTMALALSVSLIPAYWGENARIIFTVLTVISAMRTVHMGRRT